MTSTPDAAPDGSQPPAFVLTPARRTRGRVPRIIVGAVVSFAVVSLLYGPGQAAMMVGLSVICTVGLGLIPLLFLSWMVGSFVLEIWDGNSARRGATTAT